VLQAAQVTDTRWQHGVPAWWTDGGAVTLPRVVRSRQTKRPGTPVRRSPERADATGEAATGGYTVVLCVAARLRQHGDTRQPTTCLLGDHRTLSADRVPVERQDHPGIDRLDGPMRSPVLRSGWLGSVGLRHGVQVQGRLSLKDPLDAARWARSYSHGGGVVRTVCGPTLMMFVSLGVSSRRGGRTRKIARIRLVRLRLA
jgi:hypothetical protein